MVKEGKVSLCQQDLFNDNMPEFYQIYLKSQLEPCQYLLLSILIDSSAIYQNGEIGS